MPYAMRKVRNQDGYTVFNRDTKRVYAKFTSRENALAQIALLRSRTPEENAGLEMEGVGMARAPPAGARTRKEPPQYAMRKVRGQDCYKVYSRRTQRVFAKCTTKEKAERQLKLLMAIRYSPTFERLQPLAPP